ncbi:MAG: hypothetical protein WKH64_06340 [Chloroflexia bacterium]
MESNSQGVADDSNSNAAVCRFYHTRLDTGGERMCRADERLVAVTARYSDVYCTTENHLSCALYLHANGADETIPNATTQYSSSTFPLYIGDGANRAAQPNSALATIPPGRERYSQRDARRLRGAVQAVAGLVLLFGLLSLAWIVLDNVNDQPSASLLGEETPTAIPSNLPATPTLVPTLDVSPTNEPALGNATPTTGSNETAVVAAPEPTGAATSAPSEAATTAPTRVLIPPTSVPTNTPAHTAAPTATPAPPVALTAAEINAAQMGGTRVQWERVHGSPIVGPSGVLVYESGSFTIALSNGKLFYIERIWGGHRAIGFRSARAHFRRLLPPDARRIQTRKPSPNLVLDVYSVPSIREIYEPPPAVDCIGGKRGTVSITYHLVNNLVEEAYARVGFCR